MAGMERERSREEMDLKEDHEGVEGEVGGG